MIVEHRALYAGKSPEGFNEFRCLKCGYTVLVEKGIFLVVSAGDPNAIHSGGMSGIGADAEQPWFTKEGVEAWLAEGGGDG